MTTHRLNLMVNEEPLTHTVTRTVRKARRVSSTNNNLLLEHWLHHGIATEVPDHEADFSLDTPGEFEDMVNEMERGS